MLQIVNVIWMMVFVKYADCFIHSGGKFKLLRIKRCKSKVFMQRIKLFLIEKEYLLFKQEIVEPENVSIRNLFINNGCVS